MLRIAWKNVLRNRRRSIVTLSMVVLAGLLVAVFRFIAYGMHQDMIWHVVGLKTGYVQVAANGWLENKRLERALDVAPDLVAKIKATPGVRTVAPRILGQALASHESNSRFVTVVGVDPDKEREVTVLHEKILRGRNISSELREDTPSTGPPPPLDEAERNPDLIRHEALIGFRLARLLGVDVGSEIAVVGSQFDGSVGAILVKVTGVYRALDLELDQQRIYIPLYAGRILFAPDDSGRGLVRYTSLALGIDDYRTARGVYDTLAAAYPLPPAEPDLPREYSENYDPVLHDFKELNPGIVQAAEIDQISGELWISFLIIIMAFGVLNNTQTALQERMREFGILLAVGTRPLQLFIMLFFEVLILLGPGLLLGIGLGMLGSYYLQLHPIELGGEAGQAFVDVGFQPVITALVDPEETTIAILSLALPSLLFSMAAARRVFKLNPVEIINTL